MSWTEEPATHQKIVGDFKGGYSLDVTDNPPAFLLWVESSEASKFPTKVHIHSVEVPVIAHANFVPPVLIARSASLTA